MSESLDTFEGETEMPTESHQPWRATSAWAWAWAWAWGWGKRGTGRAAQDERRGGEERTGLSNAEVANEEETIIASSPSFAEEDIKNSHPPCKAERKRRRPPSPPPQADKLQKKKPRRSTKVENTSTVSLTSIAAESVDHISSYSSSETESNEDDDVSPYSSNGTDFDFDFDFDYDDDDDDVKKKPRRSTQGENTSIVSPAPIAAEEEEENVAAAPASASFSSPALANAELPKATSASPSARATFPSPFADDDKENRSALNPPPLNSKKRKNGSSKLKLQKKKSRRSIQVENSSMLSSAPIAAEEEEENAAAAPASASFSSPALANAELPKATSASPSARATFPSPSADDDKENGVVERNRKSKRRRTQLQTSDAMALDPLTLNPISSNSSNGTESDFDFDDDDDDDDDPYKPRNDFSHLGDKALRGLGTKWGEPTYSELKSNHIIFNPRSAHRADLSLPFTHNLETTRDARSLIYYIERRKGKPEKVGQTRDINRRCAAYKADDKLTIVADLDSIPLRVDEKLQHSLRELFKEIDEHPNIPQYTKDLWKVFRGDAMRLGLKTRLVVSLVEIGCQKAWKLPCRAEAFQAVGCKQVDEWLARIKSAVKKIRKVLNKVEKRNGMKPKAASPMMMLSWKPGRHQFHEDRDPTKPMSSKITIAEACGGQKNWEDALPSAAKRDPKTQEDTYSIAYTPEEKEVGKKNIEQWIETISKSGEFGLLDTNSTIFGNESALAAFLKGFGYTSQGSYMKGDLTLWVREPKDSNTMASVILACKPFCQAAHYDPKFQRDLSVRIRRNLAAEVARQVCWYVRDLDLAKTKTVTSTTEYPGLVAACACAVLIEGFHLGGEGIRIVNAIVRDIWSPPEHNACLNNGLKKSHTLMRDIPGQDPQDFAPFSRTAKREQKLGDDANQRDGRYRQRVRNILSWQTTKEERASLFDDIDETVGSKARRWREVLSELVKEGPFSILFKTRKAKMQQERAWNDRYDELDVYKNKHGNCLVPQHYPDNKALGKWVAKQRTQYRLRREGKQTPLTEERIKKLDEVGFEWSPQDNSWNDLHRLLVEYEAEHGNCLVPSVYPDNKALGKWVDTQRTQYRLRREGKHSHLTEERIKLLNEVGFEWSPLGNSWDDRYDELVEYKAEHGNCLVPRCYSKNKALGKWVANQRVRLGREGKQTPLTKKRIKKLDEVGFVWKVYK